MKIEQAKIAAAAAQARIRSRATFTREELRLASDYARQELDAVRNVCHAALKPWAEVWK